MSAVDLAAEAMLGAFGAAAERSAGGLDLEAAEAEREVAGLREALAVAGVADPRLLALARREVARLLDRAGHAREEARAMRRAQAHARAQLDQADRVTRLPPGGGILLGCTSYETEVLDLAERTGGLERSGDTWRLTVVRALERDHGVRLFHSYSWRCEGRAVFGAPTGKMEA